jgi:alcohol dehydrogenase
VAKGKSIIDHRLAIFDYQPSTRVIFGEHAIDRLGELVNELGGLHVLVVTDPGIIRAGHVEKALRSLKQASVEAFIFDRVEENPTTKHVEDGLRFALQHQAVDIIVALGGGSAMDCAKGINFLLTNGGKMEDYWGVGKAAKPMLPSIGIPTTAGTGSEAQSFALIAQEVTHQKMACGDKKARFRTVILDPGLVKTVPKKVAVITGMDAMAHAVESYVTTRRNALSQMFAREAWRMLVQNYETVLNEPENTTAWSNMLLGAHFAGTAIENSMLGAAHACANPLTAHYGITHGIAVALMLPHVIRFNSSVVNGYYEELLETADIQETNVDYLVEKIIRLKSTGGLPERLRDCQVAEADLPELAKEAAQQWTGKFNPRPVGELELLELYKRAY